MIQPPALAYFCFYASFSLNYSLLPYGNLFALEKEMATHSSILAWRIPGTEGPGGLPSTGSHRVGHDSSDLAAVICLYGASPVAQR